jgi:hypothetical protein
MFIYANRSLDVVCVGPKQACGLSVQVVSRMLTSGFKDMRPKGENVNMKIKKGEV